MSAKLIHGDCIEVLAGMKDGSVQAVICDPPYSERTHVGNDAIAVGGNREMGDGAERQALHYGYLTLDDVDVIVPELCRVSSGWVVVMTDHMLVRPIQKAMEDAGRYAFAPIPYYAPGSRCRLGGDGPSCWAIWIVACRTAAQHKWGTLPGGYMAGPGWRERNYIGGKPTQLMQCLVRDYSRPGDVVLDPFLGSGTTGVAAVRMGRDFIGVERDANAFALATKRIEAEQRKPQLCLDRKKPPKQKVML